MPGTFLAGWAAVSYGMTGTVGARPRPASARGSNRLHPRVDPRFHPRADAARGARAYRAKPTMVHQLPVDAAVLRRGARRRWSSPPPCRPTRDPRCTAAGCSCWSRSSATSPRSAAGSSTARACRTRRPAGGCSASSAPARCSSRSSSPTAPARSRSSSRSASPARGWSRAARSPASPIGIVARHRAAQAASARRTRRWGDLVIADASAIIFFYLGYIGRQFRLGQDRAERMVEELEAGREAQAAAIVLRERGRTAREMHDVLAHSLSALAVQLEGTRLLARSTGADPAVVEAVERSHRLAKDGLEEARRAIDALRGGEMPGPDGLPALADAFREQTGVPIRLRTRRRAARAPARRAAGDLPHRAGGAHQRPPPRRRRARRAAPPLRRRRHLAHRRRTTAGAPPTAPPRPGSATG